MLAAVLILTCAALLHTASAAAQEETPDGRAITFQLTIYWDPPPSDTFEAVFSTCYSRLGSCTLEAAFVPLCGPGAARPCEDGSTYTESIRESAEYPLPSYMMYSIGRTYVDSKGEIQGKVVISSELDPDRAPGVHSAKYTYPSRGQEQLPEGAPEVGGGGSAGGFAPAPGAAMAALSLLAAGGCAVRRQR